MCFEARYQHDKERYEKCDKELALLDGRAQRFAEAVSGKLEGKKKRERVDPLQTFVANFQSADPEEQAKIMARLRQIASVELDVTSEL